MIGHCFQHENGKEFSTYDRDNDRDNRNCAVVRGAGWWYSKCGSCRLNGDHTGNQLQLKFDNWPDNRFLDWVEMKIRPKDGQYCIILYTRYRLEVFSYFCHPFIPSNLPVHVVWIMT